MFCPKCGQQNNDTSGFCSRCGASLHAQQSQPNPQSQQQGYQQPPQYTNCPPVAPPPPPNAVVARYNSIFADDLFFIACICVTVAAAVPILFGSFNVLSILFAVFLWLTYASAKKNELNVKMLNYTSGCVLAQKIVGWVGVGMFGLLAVILFFAAVIGTGVSSAGFMYEIMDELPSQLYALTSGFAFSVVCVIGIFVALFAAVVCALINLFIITPLHKLSKAFYDSAVTGCEQLPDIGRAGTLCLIMGIIDGISALSMLASLEIGSFVASGGLAAAYILIYLWLKKCFVRIA